MRTARDTWKGMVARCNDPNSTSYRYYGARGIRVCERWMVFENFLADMGERPFSSAQIDRFPDQRGDYRPGNARWATAKVNSRNKTSNRLVSHAGETLCVAEWAERIGIRQDILLWRLDRGWTAGAALLTPVETRWDASGAAGQYAAISAAVLAVLDRTPRTVRDIVRIVRDQTGVDRNHYTVTRHLKGLVARGAAIRLAPILRRNGAALWARAAS